MHLRAICQRLCQCRSTPLPPLETKVQLNCSPPHHSPNVKLLTLSTEVLGTACESKQVRRTRCHTRVLVLVLDSPLERLTASKPPLPARLSDRSDSNLPRDPFDQASDAYYSSLETGQHLDGLLGLGTTAGQTHSQADALVALQQHLDLSPHSAQVMAAVEFFAES